MRKCVVGTTIEQAQRELGIADVIKLASNENAFGPSPRALEAIQAEFCNLWQYAEQSFLDIKHAIAQYNRVDLENVFVEHLLEALQAELP